MCSSQGSENAGESERKHYLAFGYKTVSSPLMHSILGMDPIRRMICMSATGDGRVRKDSSN